MRIKLKSVLIEGDRATIEWIWYSETQGKHKEANNRIIIDFHDGLITCWQE
ncbi:MAG: hypothetical protein F6K24_46670 [Okeania sp. SIO2D1]|nr:hypothetical protein [Okeania sp. SIO2D1]